MNQKIEVKNGVIGERTLFQWHSYLNKHGVEIDLFDLSKWFHRRKYTQSIEEIVKTWERWALVHRQDRDMKRDPFIQVGGWRGCHTVIELHHMTGLATSTISRRHDAGWTWEEVIAGKTCASKAHAFESAAQLAPETSPQMPERDRVRKALIHQCFMRTVEKNGCNPITSRAI